MRRVPFFGALAGALVLALSACGGSDDGGGGANPTTAPGSPTTRRGTSTASGPSAVAEMMCAAETIRDIADGATGIDTVEPVKPTWKDGEYSCALVYEGGARMTVSMTELADDAAATSHFEAAQARLGTASELEGVGDAAFITGDGSVVARTGSHVMVIDVSALPERFGKPAEERGDIAINVASLMMQHHQHTG
jgi:hypothetical protein